MKKTLAALLLALCVGSAAGAVPTVVTDVLGREVTVEIPARRVVLTFNFEEYFAAVGPEGLDAVVGWSRQYWVGRRQSTWEAFAARFPRIAEIPDVGYTTKNTFSVEAVMGAAPDVVFADKYHAVSLAGDVERLAAAGIPVVFIDYHDQSVENHTRSTMLFGQIMGREERARRLCGWYRANVDKVYSRITAETPRPRVYIENSGDPSGPADMGVTYGDLMWGAIIERCGGENIARGLVLGDEAPISAEAVLAADPEVIILAGNDRGESARNVGLGYGARAERAREQLAGYLERPGWEGLSAVKNGRVSALYMDLSRHIFDAAGIQFVAKAIHPELFADLDPMATLAEFYEQFFPVPLTGAWMISVE